MPGGGCPSFLRGIWTVVTRSVQCLQILYNVYQIGIQRLTCLGFERGSCPNTLPQGDLSRKSEGAAGGRNHGKITSGQLKKP